MNAKLYFLLFILLLFVKCILLFFLRQHGHDLFGGGNDSDYYDAYALGDTDDAVNIWPILLRWLNDIGLYSRERISFFLILLGTVLIPYLVSKLSLCKQSYIRARIFWLIALIISAYPTIFFFTLDIYRDVFMVFMFLIGIVVFKGICSYNGIMPMLFLFILGLVISYLLFLFRPYLGLGYLIALLGARFYSFKKYSVLASFLIYITILYTAFLTGLMQPIFDYRGLFGGLEAGGSNLGISFSSTTMFLPDFFKSFAFQILGFYFVNKASIFVFMVESIPFIIAFIYVLRNREYSNKFVDYLIIFFIVYGTIWLLGNDNLGTAVRLRIYNYISICIACAVIYQNKRMAFTTSNRKN